MNIEEKKQRCHGDGQPYQQHGQQPENDTTSSTKEVIGPWEVIVWTILFLVKSFLLVFCKKQEFSNREHGTVTESSEQRGATQPIIVVSKSAHQPLRIQVEQQEETKENAIDNDYDNSDDEHDEEEEEDCFQEAIRRSLEDGPGLQDESAIPSQSLGSNIQTVDLCGVRVPCNDFVHKLSEHYQSEGLAPCKICFENEANAFFPQCRHGQICVPCAKTIVTLGNAVCHICRRPIVEVDFMFTS